MRHVLVPVLVGVVWLAACGGGDSERDQVVAALSNGLLEDETFTGYEISEEEATCVAEDAVDALGTDRMLQIGVTEDTGAAGGVGADFADLDDSEVAVLGDAMESCIDDIDRVLVDAVAEGILEEPDPAFPVSESEARCIAEDVTDDLGLSRLIIVGLQSERADGDQFADLEPEEAEVFTDAFVDCLDVRSILLDNIAASGAPEDVLDCLDDNISDEHIQALFEAGFSGEDTTAAAREILSPAVETCT